MPSLTLAKRPRDAKSKCVARVVHGPAEGQYLWLDDVPGRAQVQLPPGSYFQLEVPHDPEKRAIYACLGPSGVGKSHQMLQLALRYHYLWPKRPVVLVSKLDSDATLDSAPFIRRVRIDSLVESPMELDEVENCCMIVDDADYGLNKDQQEAVQRLVDLILTQGRHSNTTLLVGAHNLTNYKATRLLHQESHGTCLYPAASSYFQLKYFLGHYYAYDSNAIKALRRCPSRWLWCLKEYPGVAVWESGAALPNQAFD